MGTVSLIEKSGSLVGGLKVDRKAGIIFGVKVLGHASLNGRLYLPETVRKAADKYEGVHVNIDHPDDKPTDQRSAYDRFGKLVRVRYIEGKGLYADLEYLVSHPMASRVAEAAEKMPDLYGLSHNAEGEGEDNEEGVFVIHKIIEVRHVDLVADPATTRSLSEGVTMNKNSVRNRHVKVNEGDDYQKQDDKMEGDDSMDGGDEQKPSLRDRLKSILDGEGSSDYKLDKMEAVCEEEVNSKTNSDSSDMAEADDSCKEEEDGSEKISEEDGEDTEKTEEGDLVIKHEDDDDTEDGESKPMESRRRPKSSLSEQVRALKAQIDDAKRTDELRELCESRGLNASKSLLADLKRMPRDIVERHITAVIAANKAAKPRSGVPVIESVTEKIPTGLSLGGFLTN